MPYVWSESSGDEGVPESGTLAPACGPVIILVNDLPVSLDDECACGCRGDDFRCERWLLEAHTASHTCC